MGQVEEIQDFLMDNGWVPDEEGSSDGHYDANSECQSDTWVRAVRNETTTYIIGDWDKVVIYSYFKGDRNGAIEVEAEILEVGYCWASDRDANFATWMRDLETAE